MQVSELIDALEVEGAGLASAADFAGWEASLPSCPDWCVRDLVAHVGEVHRWAAAIVGRALSRPEDAEADVGTAPAAADLLDWYVDGHAALVHTLRAAPEDLDAWTFLAAPSPLAFWARRQALETAVHRVDGELATGAAAPIDSALASVGIEEMLTGFGRRRREFAPGVIRLEPSETTAWQITLGPQGAVSEPDPADTPRDVTISGTTSDVYLWLWNRPSPVRIEGDEDVARQWASVRVRWS